MYSAVCARFRACIAGSALVTALTAARSAVRCVAVIVLFNISRSIRSASALTSVIASHSVQFGVVPVAPVIVAQLLRRVVLASGGMPALDRLLARLGPASLLALLTTLVLLFGFQGQQIVAQPLVIALLAVPILIQVYFNAGLAYWLSRRFGVAWCVAAPAALIGASNFFELAVATAISLFGLNSGAALATVVGVLVEVPAMLSVVAIVKRSRGWYERGAVA